MSEWQQIFTTALLTLIGGIILYVIGQIISKRLIDPANELKKEIAHVRFTLSFFAQVISTPVARNEERSTEAARALRESSARLMALSELVPPNTCLRFISFNSLPPHKDVIDAAVHLRALATYMYETGEEANESIEQIRSRIKQIEKLIQLKTSSDT